MSRQTADRILIVSALIVAATYGYRRLSEATQPGVSATRLIGLGNPVNLAAWATAWGAAFFMLSVAAMFAPGAAGAMGAMVAVTDVTINGQALFGDVKKHATPTAQASVANPAAKAAAMVPQPRSLP